MEMSQIGNKNYNFKAFIALDLDNNSGVLHHGMLNKIIHRKLFQEIVGIQTLHRGSVNLIILAAE
jgi:hypothetical protein